MILMSMSTSLTISPPRSFAISPGRFGPPWSFRALLPAEHSKTAGAKSDAAMGITLLDVAASSALTIPILAAAITTFGIWRAAFYLGAIGIVVVPLMWLWLVSSLVQRVKDAADKRAAARGEAPSEAKPAPPSYKTFIAPLMTRSYFAMLGMFFVCGITSTGVAETHLIYWAKDQGMSTFQAATLASTKTFVNSCSLFLASLHTMWGGDPSRPLAVIYFMRSISYLLATKAHTPFWMYMWAINFGFFDYATQPYTVALLRLRCGPDALSFLYSVLGFCHAMGHNVGALGAARVRDATGSFDQAFLYSALCLVVASSIAVFTPGKRPDGRAFFDPTDNAGEVGTGLSWQRFTERPQKGEEISSPLLRDALASGKTMFTRAEIDAIFDGDGVKVHYDSYIQVDEVFFKPTEIPNLLL